MPAFFISLGIGFLVFLFGVKKRKASTFAVRGMISVFVAVFISLCIAVILPKEHILVKELEIVPIELEEQKYFVILRGTADSVFFTKDKNGKIKRIYRIPKKRLNIMEQERNNGLFRVYENRSKTYKFFSFFTDTKYETLIPKNTIFENQ